MKNKTIRFIDTMKSFCFIVFATILLFACEKEPVSPSNMDLDYSLESGESFSFNFNTGDEEGVVIQIQASNFQRTILSFCLGFQT
ncbi:MAG: hypothetical protein QNL43_03755 [Crocinitomicaceae bacterium]|jgi:hypothetical protein|tara:strand:+ start:1083 stop:1337 length:255 start_codon:yes stop_codon:yes gene_type:complete